MQPVLLKHHHLEEAAAPQPLGRALPSLRALPDEARCAYCGGSIVTVQGWEKMTREVNSHRETVYLATAECLSCGRPFIRTPMVEGYGRHGARKRLWSAPASFVLSPTPQN